MYSNLLQDAMETGHVIYTSAYMSCASKEFGYDKKHQNHLALIEKMVVKDRVVNRLVSAKSLEEVFNIIQEYPLLGKFMAYQLATDINYSEIINFDENSFTIAGPGAERGIGKCFLDTEGKSNTDIIHWMSENQEQEFQRLGLNFQSLWGRPLQAIDCQNLFCETDKYCRAAFPELKSNRKNIKSKFVSSPQIIDYFYPPKWHINDKVQKKIASNFRHFSSHQKLLPDSKKYDNKLIKLCEYQCNYQQLSMDNVIIEEILSSRNKISCHSPEVLPNLQKKSEQKMHYKDKKYLKKQRSINSEAQKYKQLYLF